MLFSIPAYSQEKTKLEEDKNALMFEDVEVEEEQVEEPQVFIIVENMPEYPGGMIQLRKDIAVAIEYPREARENNISGRVFVQFVIDTAGYVTQPEVVRSVHPLLDNEAIRVVKTLKQFTPGYQRGKPAFVEFTLPINFQLSESGKKEKTHIYAKVENMPEYPGGTAQLEEDIANEIVYPAEALKKKIEGRVFIEYIIDTVGKPTDIKVVRSVHPLLDEEAIRVIQSLKHYNPGYQGGKAVFVKYTKGVNFDIRAYKLKERKKNKN